MNGDFAPRVQKDVISCKLSYGIFCYQTYLICLTAESKNKNSGCKSIINSVKKGDNKNLSTYIRREQLDGLEIFAGSFENYIFKPHFHECYTVIFVQEGIGDYSTKNKQLVVPQGSMLILTPYQVHTGRSKDGSRWRFLTAYIPQRLVETAYRQFLGLTPEDSDVKPYFNENKFDSSELFDLGLEIFTELLENSNPSGAKAQLDLFLKVLFQAGQEVNKLEDQQGRRESVNLVKDYLHEHYAEEISIEHLCDLSGLTEFSLIKSFKKYFELPPHQYLINLRVEKAKQLLKQPSPSTHIAYEVGFYDQSHFIRHFKNIVGVTPKKFKDQKFSSTYAFK